MSSSPPWKEDGAYPNYFFRTEGGRSRILSDAHPEKPNVKFDNGDMEMIGWADGTIDEPVLIDRREKPNVVKRHEGVTHEVWYDGSFLDLDSARYHNSTGGPTMVSYAGPIREENWFAADGSYAVSDRPNSRRFDAGTNLLSETWLTGNRSMNKLQERRHLPSEIITSVDTGPVSQRHVMYGNIFNIDATEATNKSHCTRFARNQFVGTCATNAGYNLIVSTPPLLALALLQQNGLFAAKPGMKKLYQSIPFKYEAVTDPRVTFLKTVYDAVCMHGALRPEHFTGAMECLAVGLTGVEETGSFHNADQMLRALGLQIELAGLEPDDTVATYISRGLAETNTSKLRNVVAGMRRYPNKVYTVVREIINGATAPANPRPRNLEDFTMVGSFIVIITEEAHSMAGILCLEPDGDVRPVLYDSNVGEVDFDWTGPYEDTFTFMESYAKVEYEETLDVLEMICIYIRTELYESLIRLPDVDTICGSTMTGADVGVPYLVPDTVKTLVACGIGQHQYIAVENIF